MHRRAFDVPCKAVAKQKRRPRGFAVNASREFFFSAISLRRKGAENSRHVPSLLVARCISSFYLNLNGTTQVFISQELSASCRFLKWRNTTAWYRRFDGKRSFRFIFIHFVLSTTLFQRNSSNAVRVVYFRADG